MIDRDDYYEYHESKEALAEGQLPDDNDPFVCQLSTPNAHLNKVCVYYTYTQTWDPPWGWVMDFSCSYPKGVKHCPFLNGEEVGVGDD